MNTALVNIFAPIAMIACLQNNVSMLPVAAAALLLSMAASALVFQKRSPLRQFGASFSNAGFIGIPLILALAQLLW